MLLHEPRLRGIRAAVDVSFPVVYKGRPWESALPGSFLQRTDRAVSQLFANLGPESVSARQNRIAHGFGFPRLLTRRQDPGCARHRLAGSRTTGFARCLQHRGPLNRGPLGAAPAWTWCYDERDMSGVPALEANPALGVYFRREDCAGFWRRALVDVIDLLLVGVICLALAWSLWRVLPPGAMAIRLVLASWAAFFFCYFVPLKRSKMGTVGYLVGRVRIVGMDGRPPGLIPLTLRLSFAVLGPWVLDLPWLSGDPYRQALRDKFAQTYVVKRKAEPAGQGKFVYRYCEICCHNFLFREVEAGA